MDYIKNPFEHILYEIEMYLTSYRIVPLDGPLIAFMNNFIVDSRAIHLRNLAVFFYKEKRGENWHVGDYINSISIAVITDEALFRDIRDYTSRATGHLLDYRLKETYKEETTQCFTKAFPIIVNAINSFLDVMNDEVKPKYKSDWEDPHIQNLVEFIKNDLLS